MSLWRIHSSFSDIPLEQTVAAPIIALIERKTSIHRDLLLSSDLNDMILESIVLRRVSVLYSTEMSCIDNNPCYHVSLPRRTLLQHRC